MMEIVRRFVYGDNHVFSEWFWNDSSCTLVLIYAGNFYGYLPNRSAVRGAHASTDQQQRETECEWQRPAARKGE